MSYIFVLFNLPSPSNQEDEQYLASKRYISEKFFNMRISHPEVPGVNGVGPMWEGVKSKAADFGKHVGRSQGWLTHKASKQACHARESFHGHAATLSYSNQCTAFLVQSNQCTVLWALFS